MADDTAAMDDAIEETSAEVSVPPSRAETPPAEAATPDEGAPSAMVVEVQSGRKFAGQIDPKSDATTLWLRTERNGIRLLRPIQWDRVVAVHLARRHFDPSEVRAAVLRQHEKMPQVAAGTAPRRIEIVGKGGRAGTAVVPASYWQRRGEGGGQTAGEVSRRVCTLEIEPWLSNWDADVEPDGLLVHVRPLDEWGRLTPVDGTISLNLIASGMGIVRQPWPFERIGRWVHRVRPEDFGPGGAVLKLPFGVTDPAFDTKVAPLGALHARLAVPGRGTFEATADMVRLRQYSAVRDELQLSTGERFFPLERTSRGK